MNIRKQNEIVYSFVLLLLSKNLFQSGYDLLQMVWLLKFINQPFLKFVKYVFQCLVSFNC